MNSYVLLTYRINPKSPLAPNSRPIQENHSRGIRTNVYYPETKVENNGIAPSDNSDNDICPDVFDNFHYQVGNVVSNPWKGLAFLRSIYLPLHLKLHGREGELNSNFFLNKKECTGPRIPYAI